MITISFDEKSLAAAKMGMMLAPKETRRAASKAVNRTLTHVENGKAEIRGKSGGNKEESQDEKGQRREPVR